MAALQFVDSHCHLNYLDDAPEAIARAKAANVGTVLCIGVEAERFAEVLACADSYPDVWASVGEHPGNASGTPDWLLPHLGHPRIVAVGETGLDYFHGADSAMQKLQQTGFRYQMQIAQSQNLPVIIHTRAAVDDTLAMLREFPNVTGVLHCFTENWDMAEQALALGYFISISGIVTFKNAENVREVARRIPNEKLLIETDAPWLAPVPHRGKTNEPAFIVDTAACVADLRGQTLSEIAKMTRENFFRLFSRAIDTG